MGWHIPKNAHWEGQIGRLKVENNGFLFYEDQKPLIPKSTNDPISLSYPFILKKSDNLFLTWYGSTISWDCGNGEMLHIIKGATASDGLNWKTIDSTLPYSIGKLQAFSRPTVIESKDKIEMWFCYRKNKNNFFVGINDFGASAPAPDLYKHFGITVENIVKKVKEKL